MFRLLTVVFLLIAQLAWARDPQPKPSGIVIHLFGPGSITSNILPETPPASPQTLPAPVAGTPASPPPYVAPSVGNILHQMFITGDPNETPAKKQPKGRAGVGG